MLLVALAVAALFALWWFTRTRDLFCLSVRHGKVLVVRGRIPGGLLSEMRRALEMVERGTVKGIKTERGGRLLFTGVDEGRQQRLRNIFSLYPISQLRCAPAIEKPTLGQALGVAWLAWIFDRST